MKKLTVEVKAHWRVLADGRRIWIHAHDRQIEWKR